MSNPKDSQNEARQREIDAILKYNSRIFGKVPINPEAKTREQRISEREARFKAIADFHNNGEKTLEECGQHFGVTRERIRQILKLQGVSERSDSYRRARRPPKRPKMTPELYKKKAAARFWSRIDITTNPDECWEWTGKLHAQGYPWTGYNYLPWRNQQGVRGQVVAWYLTHGTQPTGWIVNSCRNQKCLNPRHLVDIPPVEAIRTYRKTHTGPHLATKTHCKRGHEFTAENTISSKTAGRICRTCANIRHKKYYWASRLRQSAPNAASAVRAALEAMNALPPIENRPEEDKPDDGE